MQLPGAPSLLFLGLLLVYMPWAAMRSRHKLAALRAGAGGAEGRPLSRQAVWTSTALSLLILLVVAVVVGRSFDYDFVARPALDWQVLAATLGAFAACLLVRQVVRVSRSEEERRRLMVYVIAPRTARERVLWALACVLAGVAEETAYRGVGMATLWYALGNAWAAALILAAAFAVAHAAQGWKSGLAVFGIALVMHALVAFTGSLLPAMLVHASYDLVAGAIIARDARRMDAEAAAG
ncbi:MAG TPA: CPBP family intramembrane glutamic endopeptidase [Planctomycetota bacterium]|nr:CPBP family intramembrane glutamic endopeptidase [Planctomycetota bacterium]